MKAGVNWIAGMQFEGNAGNQKVKLDSKPPLGKGEGMTPKELVALGLGSCTAMDVVALLRKYKQTVETFRVEVETNLTQQHPAVFADVQLAFHVTGNIEPDKLKEAIALSQTKYCGVSAMIAKTAPISYKVMLNDVEIGDGQAQF